ncbi:hypothetical protein ACP4OV_023281 [Aristida adscensionis]
MDARLKTPRNGSSKAISVSSGLHSSHRTRAPGVPRPPMLAGAVAGRRRCQPARPSAPPPAAASAASSRRSGSPPARGRSPSRPASRPPSPTSSSRTTAASGTTPGSAAPPPPPPPRRRVRLPRWSPPRPRRGSSKGGSFRWRRLGTPPPRSKGAAGFSLRPELLAGGGAVALALLVIWSKGLVVAATLASVALFWVESVRSPAAASRRWRRPEPRELDSCGRGPVSPIREVDSAAEPPRPSCAGSDSESEASSLCAADAADLVVVVDPISPKRKEKRRSLRKLIAKKLRHGKRSKDKDSRDAGESKHAEDAGEEASAAGAVKDEPLPAPAHPDEQTSPPEPTTVADELDQHAGALPLAAFFLVVLVGLAGGKLPAVALTVLCAVFFSPAERLPPS